MQLPSFSAEASLYTTRVSYRGSGGAYGAAETPSCLKFLVQVACLRDLVLCHLSDFINPAACWLALGKCLPACASYRGVGSGGGSPPSCCPSGKTCKCGGTCLSGKGCVDGTCLGPKREVSVIPPAGRPILVACFWRKGNFLAWMGGLFPT